MKTIKLWNANDDWGFFQDFDRLHSSMNHLFSDFGRLQKNKESSSKFLPACDVQETKAHFVMSFDLPGLKKDEISIDLDGNTLKVSGERKFEAQSETNLGQRFERSFGRFERAFSLPSEVDSEKLEAQYENGVLTLVLPKIEEAKARKIKIGENAGLLDRVFGKKPDLKTSA